VSIDGFGPGMVTVGNDVDRAAFKAYQDAMRESFMAITAPPEVGDREWRDEQVDAWCEFYPGIGYTAPNDVWVASASADGAPYLVPLSFDWDGEALLMATPTDSPTGRNLAATRAVRLGLGHTRDVSMIEGEVEVLEIDALPQERGDRFVAHTGFDPRALATPYRWFRTSPRRIQAWREVNEMPDRELMGDGRWLI
jgi:hypothetical protein